MKFKLVEKKVPNIKGRARNRLDLDEALGLRKTPIKEAGTHQEILANQKYKKILNRIKELDAELDRNDNNPNFDATEIQKELEKLNTKKKKLKDLFGHVLDDIDEKLDPDEEKNSNLAESIGYVIDDVGINGNSFNKDIIEGTIYGHEGDNNFEDDFTFKYDKETGDIRIIDIDPIFSDAEKGIIKNILKDNIEVNFNESLKEDWAHFSFKSGSNPYIAKTEKEKEKILKKYKNKVKELKPNFYEIDDTNKSLKEDLNKPNIITRAELLKPDKLKETFKALQDESMILLASHNDFSTNKDFFYPYHIILDHERDGSKILSYRHFGSSATKDTLENFKWLIEEIFDSSNLNFLLVSRKEYYKRSSEYADEETKRRNAKLSESKNSLNDQKKISADEFKEFARKNQVKLDNIVNDWEEEFGKMTLKEWIELTINTYKDLNKDLSKSKGPVYSISGYLDRIIKSNKTEIIEPLEKLLSSTKALKNNQLKEKLHTKDTYQEADFIRKPAFYGDLEDIKSELMTNPGEKTPYKIAKRVTRDIKSLEDIDNLVKETKFVGGSDKENKNAILVIAIDSTDGTYLVDPEGYNYARYLSFIPKNNESLKEYYDPTEEITDYFTPEEQREYGIDEEGYTEDGLEQYVHCGWCEDVVPLSDTRKELNLGHICSQCQDALYSRGEKAVYEENLKEDIKDPYHNHIQYKVTLKDKDGTYTEILEIPEYVKAQDKDFDAREYFKDFYQLDDEDIISIEEVGYYDDNKDVNIFKYKESLKENLNKDSIKAEIEKTIRDYFKYWSDEDYNDMVKDYLVVDIVPTEDGRTKVEVRAELTYGTLNKIADKLDPIVQKIDKDAYFDFEDDGIINAYLNTELVESLIQGKSEDTLKKNIETEIKLGKSPKQAYAIAKSVQKKNMKEEFEEEADYYMSDDDFPVEEEIWIKDTNGNIIDKLSEKDDFLFFHEFDNKEIIDELVDRYGENIVIEKIHFNEDNLPEISDTIYSFEDTLEENAGLLAAIPEIVGAIGTALEIKDVADELTDNTTESMQEEEYVDIFDNSVHPDEIVSDELEMDYTDDLSDEHIQMLAKKAIEETAKRKKPMKDNNTRIKQMDEAIIVDKATEINKTEDEDIIEDYISPNAVDPNMQAQEVDLNTI